MMAPYVVAAVLASYASLLVELSVLHVPSVASSWRIWSAQSSSAAGYSATYGRLFALGRVAKLLLAAPLLIVYAVFGFPLVAALFEPDPLGDYLFAPAALTDVIAVVLMCSGRALAISAALTVRRQNAQTADSFHLHTDGVFRWSRNPGLVGMYAFVLGLWAATPSASMLVGIAIYALYMHIKVRMEEDFLSNKFGAPYAEYRLRTGRYLR